MTIRYRNTNSTTFKQMELNQNHIKRLKRIHTLQLAPAYKGKPWVQVDMELKSRGLICHNKATDQVYLSKKGMEILWLNSSSLR